LFFTLHVSNRKISNSEKGNIRTLNKNQSHHIVLVRSLKSSYDIFIHHSCTNMHEMAAPKKRCIIKVIAQDRRLAKIMPSFHAC
jgi:hypothetical protein